MKDDYDFTDAKRGPIAQSKGKTRITIMIDDAVLEAARARADEQGTGYQTLINTVLKKHFMPQSSRDDDAIRATLESIEKIQKEMLKILGEKPASPKEHTVFVARPPRSRATKILVVDKKPSTKNAPAPAAASKK